jgi:hypothetical protein
VPANSVSKAMFVVPTKFHSSFEAIDAPLKLVVSVIGRCPGRR